MAVRHAVHDTATEELAPLADDGWVSVVIPYVREDGMVKCRAALLEDSSYTRFEVLAEYDAERVGCPKMVKRLVDRSRYDYVCFLADDTVPKPGLLYEALQVMMTFPDAVGLVGLNSNDMMRGGATHWMASKRLLPALGGEFFHTGYGHSYCDNELVERCEAIGRYKYAPKAQLRHYHPLLTIGMDMDGDHKRITSEVNMMRDLCLYVVRRNRSKVWTILI